MSVKCILSDHGGVSSTDRARWDAKADSSKSAYINFSTLWLGDNPYRQPIDIPGANANSKIDI